MLLTSLSKCDHNSNFTLINNLHYVADPAGIKKAFGEILKQPGLDPNGYCIEWYLNEKDVTCTVRIAA
jgi:hypothetical protein